MKKLLAAIAVLLMCLTMALAVGGCSEESSDKVIVGITAQTPGFCYVGEDGSYQGFDVELVELLAQECGFEVEFRNIAADSLDAAAASGDVHMFIGTVAIDDRLGEYACFTRSYCSDATVVIVSEGSDISNPIDIEGRLVGAVLGSEAAELTDSYYKCYICHFNDQEDLYAALDSGVVDAIVVNAADADVIPDGAIVLEKAIVRSDYCVAVVKEKEALKSDVDSALAGFIEDGTIERLMAKYGIAD